MEHSNTASKADISLRTETIGLPARPRLPAEPTPQIPDYRFVKVIGRGSFGTVWLAEETLAGVFRAIKILHPARAAKPASGEQRDDSHLQREIDGVHAYQAAAKEHPHLVRVLKVGLCKVAEAEKPSSVGPVSRPVNLEERSAVSDQRSADEAPAATAAQQVRSTGLAEPGSAGERALLHRAGVCDAGAAAAGDSSFIPHPSSLTAAVTDGGSVHTAAYYVMEIADHAGGAQPHLPIDYQALTLATLLRQRERLPCQSLERESFVRGSLVRGSLVRESLLAPALAGIPSRASAPTPLGVIECSLALLDAIEHLHKCGLHHRDIKSANVLFVGGALKLADMGLTASDDVDETVGTPGYLPPPDPLQGTCGTGLPTGHSGADATNDRLRGGDVAERRPRGADATPLAAGSSPKRRFGRPDDLYALGKVMYEMLTGLSAASFPEWPADLDPASDPLLPRLRGLVNDLCHPAAASRLQNLRETKRRLGHLAAPRRTTLRPRWWRALVAGVAALALAAGAFGARWWAEQTDPMQKRLAHPPYDGSEGEADVLEVEGFKYHLARKHRAGVGTNTATGPNAIVFLDDIQTRLGDGDVYDSDQFSPSLIVAARYQIYNNKNPVTGDVAEPRGEINQLFLVIGEGREAHYTLLYHGQPGPEPGARGRFVRWVALDALPIPMPQGAKVRVILRNALTPQQAESELRDRWDSLSEASSHIASISRAPATPAPVEPSGERGP